MFIYGQLHENIQDNKQLLYSNLEMMSVYIDYFDCVSLQSSNLIHITLSLLPNMYFIKQTLGILESFFNIQAVDVSFVAF